MTKEEYKDSYFYYSRMPDNQLTDSIRQLYKRKFEQNDISAYEEHRIAARVLLDRNKPTSNGLIFHLNNFVKLLLIPILSSIFIV